MAAAKSKISIIGTGNMGRTVGISFARAGHEVFFSGRTPSAAPKAAAERAQSNGFSASFGTRAEAAAFGDFLVWTSRERDAADILGTDGIANLKKKGGIIIDLNNWDFANGTMTGNGARLDKPSLGEDLIKSLSEHGADNHVIKAFNTLPQEVFAYDKAQMEKEGVQVFLAGGSASSKKKCTEAIESLGFQIVDLGDDDKAMRMAEVMGDVVRYCLGHKAGNGGWSHIKIVGMQPVSMDLVGGREPGYV